VTALTARTKVVGKGRARREVTEMIDRWGLVHAASSAEYVPLEYRVRLAAYRNARPLAFPAWVPLTVCGEPATAPYDLTA